MTDYKLHILAQNENATRFQILNGEHPLSFEEVLMLWQGSPDFVLFYRETMKSFEYSGCFWEHPALKLEYVKAPYEAMLLKTENFSKRSIDTQAFSERIHSTSLVECFDNLGRNAKLIVPTLKLDKEVYKQFGSFINGASVEQVNAFFAAVGSELETELANGKQIWLNTAGLGVIWLHARLDTRPKYYKIKAYKNPDFLQKKI